MTNRQIVVAELPKGALTPDNFKLTEADMPTLAEGEVLLRVILMSIDAANRSWMQGATYRAAVNAGDPMPTYAICEVVESQSPRLAVGDIVAAEADMVRLRHHARPQGAKAAEGAAAVEPDERLRHRGQDRLSRPDVRGPAAAGRDGARLRRCGLGRRLRRPDRQEHSAAASSASRAAPRNAIG